MSESLVAHIRLSRGADFALDVELTCPPGITCIVGPSGSGKSTVLAVVAGLAEPDRGKIALGEEVWFSRDGARATVDVPVQHRRIAYVFQSLALFPHMTALANVAYGMQHVPKLEQPAQARAALAHMGVEHLALRKPRTFSGGEAQRVALARALARAPRLVLLDEPYSALDPELRAQLIALERELATELGVPIVHVTHSMDEVKQLADQVVRIERGKIVGT